MYVKKIGLFYYLCICNEIGQLKSAVRLSPTEDNTLSAYELRRYFGYRK